jgi:hypothetical protein
MTGYKETKNPVVVNEKATYIHLPSVKLSLNNQPLKTVTVTAKKSFIERIIDRTVLNVENSTIATGSTSMEVLEKAPRIIVDRYGNVSLNGKSGLLVMIGGKPT